MPIHSIEPRRLYQQIADQMRRLIADGEFALGERLPAERDLAAQFAVSRPTMREALIALEVQGIVEIRMGSGVYVTAREPASPALAGDDAQGPFEIMRARQLVEGELAAVAAGLATRSQLAAMRAALAQMKADIDRGVAPIRGDRDFHVRLAEAGGNVPLVRIVAQMFDERNNPLFAKLGSHFEGGASWRAAVAEHRAVVDAIARRDAEAARRAMQAHLQHSQDRFAAAWVPADEPDASERRLRAREIA